MNEFVRLLREEEASLAGRLEAVRGVLKMYDGSRGHEAEPTQKRSRLPNMQKRSRLPKDASLSGRIAKAAIEYLDDIDRRASSVEIAEHLIETGVISGTIQKPGKYVAATLSMHAHFTNDRKAGGYGLAKWDLPGEVDQTTPQEPGQG
jgi:hypothetical protein